MDEEVEKMKAQRARPSPFAIEEKAQGGDESGRPRTVEFNEADRGGVESGMVEDGRAVVEVEGEEERLSVDQDDHEGESETGETQRSPGDRRLRLRPFPEFAPRVRCPHAMISNCAST
jgi:hypothetical protein